MLILKIIFKNKKIFNIFLNKRYFKPPLLFHPNMLPMLKK
jgi:hypothetical protein